jgi:hypothetical protein
MNGSVVCLLSRQENVLYIIYSRGGGGGGDLRNISSDGFWRLCIALGICWIFVLYTSSRILINTTFRKVDLFP